MQRHFSGPGDDEDEEGQLRPVDAPTEDADIEELKAIRAGAGGLVD